MAKRNKWVAGNWKMNLDYEGAIKLTKELVNHLPELNGTAVTLCVPSVYLEVLKPFVSQNGLVSWLPKIVIRKTKGPLRVKYQLQC